MLGENLIIDAIHSINCTVIIKEKGESWKTRKKGWGGRREGAGRPSTGKSNGKAYTFTLS